MFKYKNNPLSIFEAFTEQFKSTVARKNEQQKTYVSQYYSLKLWMSIDIYLSFLNSITYMDHKITIRY